MRTNHIFLVAFLMFFTVYSQDFSDVIKENKGVWLMGKDGENFLEEELFNFHRHLLYKKDIGKSIGVKKGEHNLFIVLKNTKSKKFIQLIDNNDNTYFFSSRIKYDAAPSITFNNRPNEGNFIYYNWHNFQNNEARSLSFVQTDGLYEVIYLPGHLDKKSRQLIFTYLSLKYGISLSDAQYRTIHQWIWEKKENKEFNFRVFGLAQENYFHLKQFQSQNAKFPFMTVGVESNDIPQIKDGFYFMLGDNNGALNFVNSENNTHATLARKWKVRTSGINFSYFVEIDPKEFALESNEIWMVVSDNKELSNVKWIKGIELPNGKIRFSNISFNKPISYFGFVQAPAFFANVQIANPECGSEEGSVEISINGGTPPYFVKLFMSDGSLVSSFESSGNKLQINKEKGDYTLKISDSQERIFTRKISIVNKPFENITLQPAWLINNNYVEVSPNIHSIHEFKYHWMDKSNNKYLGTSPTIKIYKEGAYSLILENKDGCSQTYNFNVYRNAEDEISSQQVKIYPTILHRGQQLHVQLNFSENKPGNIRLFDLYGRLFFSESFSGKTINKVFRLDRAGEYMLIIVINDKAIVKKIIVESVN